MTTIEETPRVSIFERMRLAEAEGSTAPIALTQADIEEMEAERQRQTGEAFSRIKTREDADQFLRLFCDSYSRLSALIEIYSKLEHSDWLHLLGKHWSQCDNIGEYRDDLRNLIDGTGPIAEMMSEADQELYKSLPDEVTIYRGCSSQFFGAASWSLNRDIANRFPFLSRYKVADPVLITAKVRQNQIVAVKLDRGEQEIITFNAEVISVEPAKEVAAQ